MAVAYAPDALASLRDSFAFHLDATRAEKTTRIYLDAVNRLIRHLEAQGMPSSARAVRREHVESYFAERRDHVAPATLSVEYRALAVFWRWALDEDEIERDPMEKMKPPRVPDKPVPIVADDDFKKLLRTAAGKDFNSLRDTAALLLLYDAGLRRGELQGLQLADVDLKSRLAYVTGKGGHVRAIRFGDKTRVAIDRYLRHRRTHRFGNLEALWIGQDGALTPSAFNQMLAKRCAAAGLPRARVHALRHGWAHRMLADGQLEGNIAQLAGWRPGSPMIRRYGSSLAAERARAAYRSPADKL